MAGLFNILKVTVSEDKDLRACAGKPRHAAWRPRRTSRPRRAYYLVPAIAKHLCLGDSGREFQDCMVRPSSAICWST